MNESLKEEIEILRLCFIARTPPPDPSCCIHCGPILSKIVKLEQQLATSKKVRLHSPFGKLSLF